MVISSISKNTIKISIWIFLLMHAVLGWSQSIVAKVDREKVGLNERVEISYSINGSGDINRPKFSNFKVLSGPNQSTSMSIVNGSVSKKKSVSYILRPTKLGKLTLPKVTGKINGKLVQSNAVSITVVKGSPKLEKQNINLKDDIFVRAMVTKTSPYLGEQFIVTYKLYFKRRISNPDFNELPKFAGFWSKDLLKGKSNRDTKQENYKGQTYSTFLLAQYLLIPQKFGKLTLEPLSLNVNIQVPTGGRNFFGQQQMENIPTEIKSFKRVINVKPLPKQGKPANFSGAVGQFVLNNKLSTDSVKINETLTFTQTLSGKGNLKLFSLPKAVFPKDIEVYDPNPNDKISVNGNGMRGRKENEYILIPRNKGDYKFTIDGFTYFDPSKKKYFSVGDKTVMIHVEGGNSVGNSGVANQNFANQNSTTTRKEKVDLIGEDIQFINENTSFYSPSEPFFGTSKYWLFWILSFVLSSTIVVLFRIKSNRVVDHVGLKNKKAKSIAQKRLKQANVYLKSGEDSNNFYQVLLDSIFGYLKDKLDVSSADLNLEYILSVLKEKEVSEELQTGLKDIVDTCQMANYAGFDSENKQKLYSDAVSLIEKMEEKL